MRIESVGNVRQKGPPLRMEPTPGTRTRAIYDMFKSNPGQVIKCNFYYRDRGVFERLRNEYGMDLRCTYRGDRYGRISEWVLAGEIIGNEYVDYIAKHLNGRWRTE